METPFFLFGMGICGILLHNLQKMDKLNRQNKGEFNIFSYLKIERFSVLISFILVFVCCLVSSDIATIKEYSEYTWSIFMAIGYFSQKLLVKYVGKAEKIIGWDDEEDSSNKKKKNDDTPG